MNIEIKKILFWVIFFSMLIPVSTGIAEVRAKKEFKPLNFLRFDPELSLPGTSVVKGAAVFETEDKILFLGSSDIPKEAAFKTGNKVHYLEFKETEPENKIGLYFFEEGYYGLYKNLFVMRGCEGSTGYNNWLFLFKVEDGLVRFVDALHARSSGLIFDFFPDINGNKIDKNLVELKDLDNDGQADLMLFLPYRNFSIYVTLSETGIKANLNPELYKRLYNEFKKTPEQIKKEALRRFLWVDFRPRVLLQPCLERLFCI